MSEHREVIERRRKALGAYCLQDWGELAELARHVERVRPEVVAEIGFCEGGWPYLLAPFFAPGAMIVGIDPLTKNIIRRQRTEATIERLRSEGYDVQFIEGRSDDTRVMGELVRVLDGRKLDLLHIDGAHDYDSVRADWEGYSGFVRPGGLVVFHDIHSRTAAEQVYRVWDEIASDARWTTTAIGTLPRVGIGIVEM